MAFAATVLAQDLAAVAERLRRSTVEIRGAREGVGSGVIWHPSGVILTNAHVAGTLELVVVLPDGSRLPARLVARDRQRDLAALIVPAGNLPAVNFRHSKTLRVGELVFAVGNPWGITGAVAAGVIHRVGPLQPLGNQQWVQSDVRLAPGNSGGPLADASGQVLGINSMIAAGLALAVPSDEVEHFLASSMNRGQAA